MNEYSLIEILEEVHRKEFAVYDNPPKHRFSIRHRRNMKNILSPKSERFAPSKNKLTPKTAVIIVLILFLALITGAVIILRFSSFTGKVYPDNTQMFAYDDTAPTAIEQIYYLEGLPDNFILTESYGVIGDDLIRKIYINQNNDDILIFEQYTKNRYNAHFDNERSKIISIETEGFTGFIWKPKDSNNFEYITIVWDVGDYILSLWCNLDENEAADLAKSAKIFKFQLFL